MTLVVGRSATVQALVARLGDDPLEIDVTPRGEGHFKINGRVIAHVNDAEDGRRPFRNITKTGAPFR